jgi:hypothetical protein
MNPRPNVSVLLRTYAFWPHLHPLVHTYPASIHQHDGSVCRNFNIVFELFHDHNERTGICTLSIVQARCNANDVSTACFTAPSQGTVKMVTQWHRAKLYIRLNVATRRLAMADQPKMLYCRGCNTECEEHHFDGYKQCNMCREKSFTRKRHKVTCDCGRTLLACSLKIHLRSIYHAEHSRPAPLVQQPPQIKKQIVLPAEPVVKKQLLPTQQAIASAAGLQKQMAAKQTPVLQPPRPAVKPSRGLVFIANVR